MFNAEYNKKRNVFREGIVSIRRKNNFFFLNTRTRRSIYDMTDINSYFTFYETGGTPELTFRENTGLPEDIKKEIQSLFDRVWEPAAQ